MACARVHSDLAYSYTRVTGSTITDSVSTRTRTEEPGAAGALTTTNDYDTVGRTSARSNAAPGRPS